LPFEITFHIYLASRTHWVHLKKVIRWVVVPRVGEFIKFKNDGVGDYFAHQVMSVEYRETGEIEVMMELLENVDDRMYSFEGEAEFLEYYNSYLSEGWSSPRGIVTNPHLYPGSRGVAGTDP